MTATYWEIGCRIVGSEQQGQQTEYGEALISNSPKIWSHILAGLWVAHLTQMLAFFLPLPALKILQTPSAKSVPLPKLQASCRLMGANPCSRANDGPQLLDFAPVNRGLLFR
jgi:hypothetical protein